MRNGLRILLVLASVIIGSTIGTLVARICAFLSNVPNDFMVELLTVGAGIGGLAGVAYGIILLVDRTTKPTSTNNQ